MSSSNKYKVVNENNRYYVVEKKTNLYMKEFFAKNKAKEFADKLNEGRGFNGFTPAFIVKKVA